MLGTALLSLIDYSVFAQALGITSSKEALARHEAFRIRLKEEDLRKTAGKYAEMLIKGTDALAAGDTDKALIMAKARGLLVNDLDPEDRDRVHKMALNKMRTSADMKMQLRGIEFKQEQQ